MPDKSHPSYGMLSLSRSSISGDGVALFGSSIRHNDTIRMSISAGVLDRHGNQTRYYSKHSNADKYVEVEMSYTQFAEVITSLNIGDGVPVTVMTLNGQRMPPCPYEDKQKLMRREFNSLAKSVAKDIDVQTKEIAELLQNKKTLTKGDKDFILSILKGASAKISDHMPFINEMFAEQMEKTVTEAKGEFESFLQNKLGSIAMEAIAGKQKEMLAEQYSGLLIEKESVEENGQMHEMESSNQRYVSEHAAAFQDSRFYVGDDTIREVYYNSDSSAGGQLVTNYYSSNAIAESYEKHSNVDSFWELLEGMAKQHLTDINAPEFAEEAKEFAELPCDFGGNKEETMNALCSWAYSMEENLPRQGMDMGGM